MSAVLCRGCGKEIAPASPVLNVPGARWSDSDGFMVCVKVPLSEIGRGRRPDYVFHEPMPAGLAGGPEAAPVP